MKICNIVHTWPHHSNVCGQFGIFENVKEKGYCRWIETMHQIISSFVDFLDSHRHLRVNMHRWNHYHETIAKGPHFRLILCITSNNANLSKTMNNLETTLCAIVIHIWSPQMCSYKGTKFGFGYTHLIFYLDVIDLHIANGIPCIIFHSLVQHKIVGNQWMRQFPIQINGEHCM